MRSDRRAWSLWWVARRKFRTKFRYWLDTADLEEHFSIFQRVGPSNEQSQLERWRTSLVWSLGRLKNWIYLQKVEEILPFNNFLINLKAWLRSSNVFSPSFVSIILTIRGARQPAVIWLSIYHSKTVGNLEKLSNNPSKARTSSAVLSAYRMTLIARARISFSETSSGPLNSIRISTIGIVGGSWPTIFVSQSHILFKCNKRFQNFQNLFLITLSDNY